MNKTLYIGTLARETGHSIHTIRWYEEQGLIPGVIRDGGGRRVYQKDHIEWLNFLHFLRHTGMSIKEMQAYTELAVKGWRSLGERKALLQAHRVSVLEEVRRLERALELIDLKVAYYSKWEAEKKRPEVSPVVG